MYTTRKPLHTVEGLKHVSLFTVRKQLLLFLLLLFPRLLVKGYRPWKMSHSMSDIILWLSWNSNLAIILTVMIDWLIGWLIHWLVAWWLIDWLSSWSIDILIDWLIIWLFFTHCLFAAFHPVVAIYREKQTPLEGQKPKYILEVFIHVYIRVDILYILIHTSKYTSYYYYNYLLIAVNRLQSVHAQKKKEEEEKKENSHVLYWCSCCGATVKSERRRSGNENWKNKIK